MFIPQELKKKFFSRTIKGPGCWTYTRSMCGPMFQGVRYYPHRLSYMIHKGPIPRGLMVMHRCDNYYRPNPPCTNPDHLMLGTGAQNQADKFIKGRSCFGEKHGCHKLTEAEVRSIDKALSRGVAATKLAPFFGVSPRTIQRLKTRENWRYLAVPAA
jgi:hypothetical protein